MHQSQKTIDQIVDIAERPGLGTVTVNGQGFILQGLQNEVGYPPTIIRMLIGAIGIEYSGNLYPQFVLPQIIKEKRLRAALALVITGPGPYGVY